MNTTLPTVTMHLESIGNAVRIANDIFQGDLGSGTYAVIPTPRVLDHQQLGNMGQVIKANMIEAGVSADILDVRAYRSSISLLFSQLDTVLSGALPASVQQVKATTPETSTSKVASSSASTVAPTSTKKRKNRKKK